MRGRGDEKRTMEQDTNTYDARFIADLLIWLRAKAAGLNDDERNALLHRANRLPGLHGRFEQHADRTLHFHTPRT